MPTLTNPHGVVQHVLDLVEAALPGMVATDMAADTPAVVTFGFGDPSYVGWDEFPTVRVNLSRETNEAKVAGPSSEPRWPVDVFCVYRAEHNPRAYLDGLQIADLIKQVFIANRCATGYWRYMLRTPVLGMVAGQNETQGGVWQGGYCTAVLIGENTAWVP